MWFGKEIKGPKVGDKRLVKEVSIYGETTFVGQKYIYAWAPLPFVPTPKGWSIMFEEADPKEATRKFEFFEKNGMIEETVILEGES